VHVTGMKDVETAIGENDLFSLCFELIDVRFRFFPSPNFTI
jgi:hypothetical protein